MDIVVSEANVVGMALTSDKFGDSLPHVLAHVDWFGRGSAPVVCKEWHRVLVGDHHWRWLCKRLSVEHDVDEREVVAVAPGCGLRGFRFERVFSTETEQQQVYDVCGSGAVAELLNGQSGCVLVHLLHFGRAIAKSFIESFRKWPEFIFLIQQVYGQTGAGKTYTMFGEGNSDPRLPHVRFGPQRHR